MGRKCSNFKFCNDLSRACNSKSANVIKHLIMAVTIQNENVFFLCISPETFSEKVLSQWAFTCSKSNTRTQEQGVK